jgi:hypothetical protein
LDAKSLNLGNAQSLVTIKGYFPEEISEIGPALQGGSIPTDRVGGDGWLGFVLNEPPPPEEIRRTLVGELGLLPIYNSVKVC